MKNNLISVAVCVALSSCSFILPSNHDSSMFDHIVNVKVEMDRVSCDNKNWLKLMDEVERLKVYTVLREDPQAENVISLEEGLKKANKTENKVFCESIVKINKTRVDVITKAWKGR